MKYLKRYKQIKESFQDDVEDIKTLLGSLSDDDFNIDVAPFYHSTPSVTTILNRSRTSDTSDLGYVVNITKKRRTGVTILRSILDKDDRISINSSIDQILSTGDYQLFGQIEYKQNVGIFRSSSPEHTILTGKVEDIDIDEYMKKITHNTEVLIRTGGLTHYKVPENRSITKPFLVDLALGDNPPMVGYPKLSGMRKATFYDKEPNYFIITNNDSDDYYTFVYKRPGGLWEYDGLGPTRFSLEYVVIPKDEIKDIIIPSLSKVSFKLSKV